MRGTGVSNRKEASRLPFKGPGFELKQWGTYRIRIELPTILRIGISILHLYTCRIYDWQHPMPAVTMAISVTPSGFNIHDFYQNLSYHQSHTACIISNQLKDCHHYTVNSTPPVANMLIQICDKTRFYTRYTTTESGSIGIILTIWHPENIVTPKLCSHNTYTPSNISRVSIRKGMAGENRTVKMAA